MRGSTLWSKEALRELPGRLAEHCSVVTPFGASCGPPLWGGGAVGGTGSGPANRSRQEAWPPHHTSISRIRRRGHQFSSTSEAGRLWTLGRSYATPLVHLRAPERVDLHVVPNRWRRGIAHVVADVCLACDARDGLHGFGGQPGLRRTRRSIAAIPSVGRLRVDDFDRKMDRTWPNMPRSRTMCARNLPNSGRIRLNLWPLRPIWRGSAKCGPGSTKVGVNLPELSRIRAKFDRHRPNAVELQPALAQVGPSSVEIAHILLNTGAGRRRPRSRA